MNNLDILIYAAVAVFLLSRLWSVLGQRGPEDEDIDQTRAPPFASPRKTEEEQEAVVILEGRAKPLVSEALTEAGHARTSLAGHIDAIKALDPAFDEKRFLDGARKAFLAIVTAFAKGDLSAVARFLGPRVRGSFEDALKTRRASGKRLENKVDRIAAADIIAARLEGSVAQITVEFISHQNNTFIDDVSGVKEAAPTEEVRDKWVFERDLKSLNINWLLIETLA